ncbi:MAG TPA: HAD family hydrolase [Planctomycetes bacterium]|nr:HAD family hydrolase [Planctomycetota bacterium]
MTKEGGASEMDPDLQERLKKVRLLVLDVDGVLTDGKLYFDSEGRETKIFHVHDGSGLVYWRRLGFCSALLSGRDSPAVRARAASLKIDEVHLGLKTKLETFEEILRRRGIHPEESLYMGDDLLDLPVLRAAGIAVTVPQGRPEVKAVCDLVTKAPGGEGAVREMVEILLVAKGLFQKILAVDGQPFPGQPTKSDGGQRGGGA